MKFFKPLLITSTLILAQNAFSSQDNIGEGEKLFKATCNACHGIAVGGMDMDKRIAPPIVGVRKHYLDAHPDKESFVKAITSWLEKQSPEKSLMPGAIQKFKLMPPLSVPKEDAEKIAAYLYAGNIEVPEGFEKHEQEMHGMDKKGMAMMGMGKEHNMQMMQQHQQGKMQGEMQQKSQQRTQQRMQQGNQQKGKQHQAMMNAMRGMGMVRKNKQHGMNGMMRQLNLSPQQKQKMQALIQQRDQAIKPIRQELRQIKQAINQLDTTSPNYKAQIFSLADAKAQRIRHMVIEKGEMRMKIESLLNPEQRAKFKQIRQNRQKHRQQNH